MMKQLVLILGLSSVLTFAGESGTKKPTTVYLDDFKSFAQKEILAHYQSENIKLNPSQLFDYRISSIETVLGEAPIVELDVSTNYVPPKGDVPHFCQLEIKAGKELKLHSLNCSEYD